MTKFLFSFLFLVIGFSSFAEEKGSAYPAFLVETKSEKCAIPLSPEILNQYSLKPEHLSPFFKNMDKESDFMFQDLETKTKLVDEHKLCSPDTTELAFSSILNHSKSGDELYKPAGFPTGLIFGLVLYTGFCVGAGAIGYAHVIFICAPVWMWNWDMLSNEMM